MKILVISDIHANLTALEAVLDDARRNDPRRPPFEAVWCLGDLIGYGPDPNECVARVRALPNLICLIGNHDEAALGGIPLSRFNEDARLAASWTRKVLTPENEAFLRSQPSMTSNGDFTLAHGSPRAPVWEYILDVDIADLNFDSFQTDYCLVGHSHVQMIFQREPSDSRAYYRPADDGEIVFLTPRMILNPGSVGQPRDMDPRASYALLDTEAGTWVPKRVDYDIAAVQTRILAAGLPERQALRLVAGW